MQKIPSTWWWEKENKWPQYSKTILKTSNDVDTGTKNLLPGSIICRNYSYPALKQSLEYLVGEWRKINPSGPSATFFSVVIGRAICMEAIPTRVPGGGRRNICDTQYSKTILFLNYSIARRVSL